MERYSIKFDKGSNSYDVFFGGFSPMYCGTFATKKEAKLHIKRQKNDYGKQNN